MERTSGSLIESSSGLIFQFGAQIKLTDAWPRMARRPLQQHIKETYGKIMSVKTQRGSGPTQLLTADDSQFLAGSASEDQERGFCYVLVRPFNVRPNASAAGSIEHG